MSFDVWLLLVFAQWTLYRRASQKKKMFFKKNNNNYPTTHAAYIIPMPPHMPEPISVSIMCARLGERTLCVSRIYACVRVYSKRSIKSINSDNFCVYARISDIIKIFTKKSYTYRREYICAVRVWIIIITNDAAAFCVYGILRRIRFLRIFSLIAKGYSSHIMLT